MSKISRFISIPAFAVLAALCMSSCSNGIRRELSRAESLLNDYPDSALAVVNAIDSTGLHAKSLIAEYRVIRAMALDKNDVDDGRYASALLHSVEYYDRHPSRHQRERMLAHYYLGDQYLDGGQRLEAMLHLTTALDLAEPLEDWFYCGMACRETAMIHSYYHDESESYECLKLSVDYFQKSGRESHSAYSRLLIITPLTSLGRYDEVLEITDQLSRWAIENNDSEMYASALRYKASTFLRTNPSHPDSTIAICRRIQSLGKPLNYACEAAYSLALAQEGDLPAAAKQMQKAYASAHTHADSLTVAYYDYKLQKASGNREKALALYESVMTYADRESMSSIRNSVFKQMSGIYHAMSQDMSRKIKQDKTILWLSTISLILLLALSASILMMVVMRSRYQKERISFLESRIEAYSNAVSSILDFGFGTIGPLCEIAYRPGCRAEDFTDVLKKYLKDENSRAEIGRKMEESLNTLRDNLVSCLRAEIPDMKEKDVALFVYYAFGLSYKTIYALTAKESENVEAVYRRVSRLRDKIKHENIPHRDWFLSFLNRK